MIDLGLLPAITREVVFEVCRRALAAGGHALLVGATSRDLLAGIPTSHVDIEVSGVEIVSLGEMLEGLHAVAASERTGVFRLQDLNIGISLPWVAVAPGRESPGLEAPPDPHLPFKHAARRHGFTVDAIGLDPLDQVLVDPFNGCADLERRVLRAVDDTTFAAEHLRVLQGMQLIARFGLTPEPRTIGLCRSLGPGNAAPDAVFQAWRVMILSGSHIKAGLDFLLDTDWVRHFPELAATVGVAQDATWHPEGDVFVHTGHCMDEFAKARIGDGHEDLIVGLAVLCHDFGKPSTTEFKDGRWRAHGHEAAGLAPTRSFIQRLTAEPIWREIEPLVGAHLRPSQLHKANAGKAAVRRLARQVGRLDRLVRVAEADARGRPPLVIDRYEPGPWLLEMAQEEEPPPSPEPILSGHHLIEKLGMEPGPDFQPILSAALEAQLAGSFDDLNGALHWVRRGNATHRT